MKRAFFLLAAVLALSTGPVQADDDDDREHHTSSAKFYGTVEALPPSVRNGIWWVNGREVIVSPRTKIKEKRGSIAVGAYVKVEGYLSGMGLAADEIEIKGSRRH
jgi:hypothetical protein